MKIGEAVYKAQSEAPAGAAADAKPADNVVDAEFEEVNDHKKSA
jgi:molecular chaperone DnaK